MIFYRGDLDFVFFARFVDGTAGGRGAAARAGKTNEIIVRKL